MNQKPSSSFGEDDAPKTTHPDASSRREREASVSAAKQMRRTLDAMPDRIDVRDLLYQPRLGPLPDLLVNCDRVPEILDQGAEGACTGFALAAVINYLLYARNLNKRHGGFDNDEATLNSVLWRVLEGRPNREFSTRDLQY